MNPTTPRAILCGIAVCSMALVFKTDVAQAKPSERRASTRSPNILFVLADQWRYEAFGYAGNRDVKTPNLDRLQREGIRFVNAVSAMPVCCPTRMETYNPH